jgi:uncharacterized protein (TIGR02611 family)
MKMPVSNPVECEVAARGADPPVGYGPALLKKARRAVVFVLGVSVLAVGIVMIVAPGPAVIVIPLGLGILATEFLWARRVLDSLKQRLADAHAATAQAPLPRWLRFLLPKNR